MLLNASDMFKKSVRGDSGQTLGRFMNLIIDTESQEARMLIFPELRYRKMIQKLLDTLKGMSGDLLSELLGDQFKELFDNEGLIDKDKMDSGVEEAINRLKVHMAGGISQLRKIYYLVPVSEISELKRGRIILLMSKGSYFKSFIDPPTKTDVAFFSDTMFRDDEWDLPISLNLVYYKSRNLADPEDKVARIYDAQFDVLKGVITGLIVKRPGRSSPRHLVAALEIDFDNYICEKKFESYPILSK